MLYTLFLLSTSPAFKYPKMYSILEKAVPATHWNGDKQLLAVKKEVDAFLAKWKARTVLGDQLTEERAAVARRRETGKEAQAWYDNRAEERAGELDRIKDERAAVIQARLTAMGYASELAFLLQFKSICVVDPLPQDVPDFYQHYHVNQSRRLIDRIWRNIDLDMIELMLRMRKHMEENDRCIVLRERRKVIHLLYLHWRSQRVTLEKYPAYYLMPGPADIIEHHRFDATLDLPSSINIDAWTRIVNARLQTSLPNIVKTWRRHRIAYFPSELRFEPSLLLPGILEDHTPMRRKHGQLQLATVVFRCTDDLMHWVVDGLRARDEACAHFDRECGMWVRDAAEPAPLLWYPVFLTHPCASMMTYEPDDDDVHPKPAAHLSLNATYQYRDYVWGTSVYQQGWSRGCVVFDAPASRTVGDILEACGMSRTTTTVEELDTRDPRVVCLRCSFGARCNGERPMRVFGWREAVNHSVKTHFGNSLVKWECLSPEDTIEARRLEAIEAVKENYPTAATHRVWCCTSCRHHTHDPGRLSWAGLQAHFRQNPTHGNVDDMDAQLNQRYFRDPEMTRRALPRIKMSPGKVSAPTMSESPS